VANAFNTFFIAITEKFMVQPIEKGDAITIIKDSLLETFPA
jgi:hypothetical protein